MTETSPSRPVTLELCLLLAVTILLFILLGISPKADRLTWLLENLPVMLALPLLVLTYRRFPLTPLAYRLIFVHALILMTGGYYSYARVPLGDWIKNAWSLSRNHYDRLGHLAQGFVPAILTRELLLRKTELRPGKMLSFLVVSVSLAISASYELFEWRIAVATGEAATEFLGTQGDPWDTQWDMFMALIGATLSLFLLSGVHDHHLAGLGCHKNDVS